MLPSGRPHVLHALYARRLRRLVRTGPLPRHVAIVMDGNRRWARAAGLPHPSLGHRYGAERAEQVLSWCAGLRIPHVTVFVCSTENLRRRDAEEIDYLMRVIEHVLARRLARPDGHWRVQVVGALELLPESTAGALERTVESTRHRSGGQVTLAIGYGGRQEIVDAVRRLVSERAGEGLTLTELADTLRDDDLTGNLYLPAQPDPDLIIRTSGEQRMSNFLLWQGAYAELYFCDVYWPAFRELDFLRALRTYAARQRRRGL